MISDLYSTHQSRDLVNPWTIVVFSWGKSLAQIWDTRGMEYAPLNTHYIRKKCQWKLWYCFESLALRYSLENLPYLPTLSTYFTLWHRYYCLYSQRVTALKWVSNICKIFAVDFFSRSDGSGIFLFLFKYAFKTKTLLVCLKEINSYNVWIIFLN